VIVSIVAGCGAALFFNHLPCNRGVQDPSPALELSFHIPATHTLVIYRSSSLPDA